MEMTWLSGAGLAARFLGLKIPRWVEIAIATFVLCTLSLLWHHGRVDATIRDAKTEAQHQQLAADQKVVDQLIASWRDAATKAIAEDAANVARVQASQAAINSETEKSYEARIADARATAQRLRDQLAASAGSPGGSAGTPVPGLRPAAGGSAQAAAEDGFSVDDRLTATEQAIQLDELIKWVRKQAAVPVNGK